MKKYLLLILMLIFEVFPKSQSVTFNITTVTYGGQYKPAHCFAMWVTDANGSYVTTINRQAQTYIQYLTNFKSSAGTRYKTDGITGASLNSHNYQYTSQGGSVSRIPFVWNCKNYSGNVVADGTYYINVEFTEANATGKLAKYTFTKGTTAQNISYTNVSSYFTNASLVYTPATTAIESISTKNTFSINYVKSSSTLQVNVENFQNTDAYILIFDTRGVLLYKESLDYTLETLNIDMSNFNRGIYFICLDVKGKKIQTKKIFVN